MRERRPEREQQETAEGHRHQQLRQAEAAVTAPALEHPGPQSRAHGAVTVTRGIVDEVALASSVTVGQPELGAPLPSAVSESRHVPDGREVCTVPVASAVSACVTVQVVPVTALAYRVEPASGAPVLLRRSTVSGATGTLTSAVRPPDTCAVGGLLGATAHTPAHTP